MEGASDRAPNRRLRQILQVTRRSDQESTLEGSIGLVSSPVYAVQQHITPPQEVEPDDIPYPLTKEEALSFLENVLEIPNPEELIERDPMAFLNTYIYNMITKLPFTNLPHVSQPMNDKHNPTFEECKMAILRREGGHCFYKNTFSKALLDLMGYDTFHVGGK
ncbi:hypothetical protein BSL78_29343 [Apostichopus japonicus]|uniref:Arylamine N-acetyltransferase n=1 Tax=Stichopus japonicus TaxID=307972 RepID=A0A2G8JDL0_STIJA|nr:hypothetical protein BSL78_29343 [Apostichopus japonicus]